MGEGDQAKPGGEGSKPPEAEDALFEPSAAETLGLRPRLRLTPTASDEEFKTVFDSAAGRAPPGPKEHESLTWKDLLSSIDETPIEDGQLAERMIADIESLGVDAAALLPRSRIAEIAAVEGEDERRAAIRHMAPAAVRRLQRRLFTDRPFRIHTERFGRHYRGLLSEAVASDPQGAMTLALLGSTEGRAFLLLDAASADFG